MKKVMVSGSIRFLGVCKPGFVQFLIKFGLVVDSGRAKILLQWVQSLTKIN
jgi:hypothetical protein